MTPPVALVPVDPRIMSSYQTSGGTGGKRETLIPLSRLGKAGIATPAAAAALLQLHDAVTSAGGDFRVTELHRDVAVQAKARELYEKGIKKAFVALPGRSNHNAGRAIDIHISELKFPGVAPDKQLDKLWEVAVPIGWSPIIKAPSESASESWHFDFWDDMRVVYNRLGYEQGAFAGALLVGHAGPGTSYASVLQALLSRAGLYLGKIDGIAGNNTIHALATGYAVDTATAGRLIAAEDTSVFAKLLALPPGMK